MMLSISLQPLFGVALPLAAAGDPKNILSGANTYAGRNSGRLATYLIRRLADGVSSSVAREETEGHRLYRYDAESALSHFRYQMLSDAISDSTLRAAHARTHHGRRQWAQDYVDRRLAWHSSEWCNRYDAFYGRAREITERRNQLFFEAVDDHNRMRSKEAHDYHVDIAPRASEREAHRLELLLQMEQTEVELQITGYQDLIAELARRQRPLRGREQRSFDEALRFYQKAAEQELALCEQMIAGFKHPEQAVKRSDEAVPLKPNDVARKKFEQKTYMALEALHQMVLSLYQKRGMDLASDQPAPLSFRQKIQSWFIARGRGQEGMPALERYLETTWNLKGVLRAGMRQELSYDRLDQEAAVLFGMQNLAYFYRTLNIGVPEGFPAFAHHKGPGLENIFGHDRLLQSAAEYVLHPQRSSLREGAVADWRSHSGPLDYTANLGLSELLGMPWAAIMAEEGFGIIPILGKFLMIRGALINREDPTPAYEQLKERILAERMLGTLYGGATRVFDYPFPSPYADLAKAAALHVPGEFMPSHFVSVMPIKLAMESERPLLTIVANLARGGIPEPNVPRNAAGALSPKNMLVLAQAGVEDGFVAVADLWPVDSFIRQEDFPGESRGRIYQYNEAVRSEIEREVGYRMDAGAEAAV